MKLVANLAHTEVSIGQLMALQSGDVISLDRIRRIGFDGKPCPNTNPAKQPVHTAAAAATKRLRVKRMAPLRKMLM